MKDKPTKTITVKDIDEGIWRQAKAIAALNGQSISNFVNEALRKATNGDSK